MYNEIIRENERLRQQQRKLNRDRRRFETEARRQRRRADKLDDDVTNLHHIVYDLQVRNQEASTKDDKHSSESSSESSSSEEDSEWIIESEDEEARVARKQRMARAARTARTARAAKKRAVAKIVQVAKKVKSKPKRIMNKATKAAKMKVCFISCVLSFSHHYLLMTRVKLTFQKTRKYKFRGGPYYQRGGAYTHAVSGKYNITLYTAELKRFHYVAYKDEDEANEEFERVIGNKEIIDNIIYRWQQKKRNRGTKKTKKR